MKYLRADTAATILIGPAVAIADGVTPVTDVTLAGADHAELMKHDGTTFVDLTSDSRTLTHKEGGWYTLTLWTVDTDTEGRLTVLIIDTDKCLPIWLEFMVMNQPAYDALYAVAATDYLPTDVTQIAGTAVPNTSGKLHVLDDEGNPVANESKQDIIDTNIDDIETDTNELQTDWHDAGRLDALIDAIKAVTDALPDAGALNDLANMNDTDLPAVKTVVDAIQVITDNIPDSGALTALLAYVDCLPASLNNLSAAEVNAEVVDALGTDTLSELSQGVPASTPTIKAALMLLYMIARNQLTTTASSLGVYNDAGTKIAKKALSDDDTTYTEGKMASGA